MTMVVGRRQMGIVSLLLVRIDMIDSSTLSYYGSGSGSVSVGGFTWSGHFTWEGLPAKVETKIMFWEILL